MIDNGQEVFILEGFDEAIIGHTLTIGRPLLIVYSMKKMAQILMERDGMDWDGALEYIDYNYVGAWSGESTPIIVIDVD